MSRYHAPVAHRQRILIPLMALALMGLGLLGCGSKPGQTRSISSSSTSSNQGRVNYLNQAMDYVFSDSMYRPEAFVESVTGGLNNWADSIPETDDWELDPLVDSLPLEYRQDLVSLKLDELGFSDRDAEFLREVHWCRSLALWLQGQDRYPEFRYLFPNVLDSLSESEKDSFSRSDDRLAFLLQKSQSELTEESAKRLANAARVFDWTIRNVQLSELPELPSDLEIRMEALASAPNRAPAAKGVKGPGYTLFPWQSMKFGRGDAWQRARVMIAICRQLEIDVVMLAIPDSETQALTPWLPAVCLDGQTYLFDTELGVAIPAVGRLGIATLAEAKTNPAILERLTIFDPQQNEELPYRWQPDQLSDVAVLLDFSPQWYSRSMAAVSTKLTGDRRLLVSLMPSTQAERIKSSTGIEKVQLWDVPYATLAYRRAYDRAVERQDDRVASENLIEERSFDIDVEFLTGRHRAILGLFNSDEETSLVGAKDLFAQRRFDDEFIKALESSPELQYYYGIDRSSLTADQIGQYVQAVQGLLTIVRTHASYWLGLAHYETGSISSAKNWLKRVRKNDPNGIWTHGTSYNLARCDESLGNYQQAIEQFELLDSPQRAGDLLRAEWLRPMLEQ